MEQKTYEEMLKEHGYHGLQLIHMTYEEARKFAGDWGMNSILYNYDRDTITMARLKNDGERMFMTAATVWGPKTEILDPEKYDIYWIGGK